MADAQTPAKGGWIPWILGLLVVGLMIPLVKDWITKEYLEGSTTAKLELKNSAQAVFPSDQSYEIIELLAYEASTSDLMKNIEITATFKESTEIVRYNVVYSVDIEGYTPKLYKRNYLILNLEHNLNTSRRANIFILTKKIVKYYEPSPIEVPEISIRGLDKNGKWIYQ